jgi:replication initiation and membrane attachment protein DnaB
MSNNNTMPSPSDINIINELSSKYGLPSQVINPLIHYVLSNYDNMLPTNLVYKIASSLARSGITTTVDAVNYLNKKRTNSKPKTVNESVNVSASQEDVALLLAELGDD